MTGRSEADGEAHAAGRSRRHGGRLSEILSGLAADERRSRISVADIFQAMGDRAFGALILIFALPNIVPTLFEINNVPITCTITPSTRRTCS